MEDMMRSIGSANKEGKKAEKDTPTTEFEDDKYSFNIEWLNNKKFIKQLEKDNIDVVLLREELSRQNRRKRHYTWKEKTLQIIKGNFVQIMLCILILIDAVIVITEIVLEIHAMKSMKEFYKNQSTDLKATITKKCNSSFSTGNALNSHIIPNITIKTQAEEIIALCNYTFLGSFSSNHKVVKRNIHAHSLANKDKSHSAEGDKMAVILHTFGLYLHYISIAVLSIFMVELILRVICIGEKFFKKKAEMFDGIIIVTSFLADIIFVQVDSPEIAAMVIFLLWRIVRLINALMMHEKQRDEFRITLQKKTRRICQIKVNRLSTEKELLTKHVVSLEELCRELGSNEEQLKKCKPRFKKYSKEQTNNALKSIAALTTGFMGGMVGAPSSNQSAINKFSGTSPSPSIQSPNNSRQLKVMRKISETPYSSFDNSENDMTPITSHTLFLPSSDSLMASVDRESLFKFTVNKGSSHIKCSHSLKTDSEQDDKDMPMIDADHTNPLLLAENEDPANPHLLDISVIQRQSTKSSNEDQDKSTNTNAHSRGYGSSVSPSTSASEPNEIELDDGKPSLKYIFTQAERCRTFRERFRSQDVIKTQESSLDSPPSADDGIGSTNCSHFPKVSSSK